ncbi:MAG: hypothetical protein RR840_06425 [Clostridium sp.]
MFSLMNFENTVIKKLRENSQMVINILEDIAIKKLNPRSGSIDFEVVVDENWVNILINPHNHLDNGFIDEYVYNGYYNGYNEIISNIIFYENEDMLQKDMLFDNSEFLDKLCDSLEKILIKWFSDCVMASSLINKRVPIYVGIHESNIVFNIKEGYYESEIIHGIAL